jgi:hypothetical protein
MTLQNVRLRSVSIKVGLSAILLDTELLNTIVLMELIYIAANPIYSPA